MCRLCNAFQGMHMPRFSSRTIQSFELCKCIIFAVILIVLFMFLLFRTFLSRCFYRGWNPLYY